MTGTGGGLTRTVPVSLTVTEGQTPNFSLSASPPSLTLNRGASGTSTIGVARTGGFTGSVAFSIAGLPSGVTATLQPAVDHRQREHAQPQRLGHRHPRQRDR